MLLPIRWLLCSQGVAQLVYLGLWDPPVTMGVAYARELTRLVVTNKQAMKCNGTTGDSQEATDGRKQINMLFILSAAEPSVERVALALLVVP